MDESCQRITKMQRNRSNVPTNTPGEYYKRTVAIPFLDKFMTQMRERFDRENVNIKALMQTGMYEVNNSTTADTLLLEHIHVEDARFPNGSSIITNWTDTTIGCSNWEPSNHILFQLANAVITIGLLAPNGKHGILFLHSTFVLGFLFLAVWSWVILCAPDFFSWNFAFLLINVIQMFVMMYSIRPIKFNEEFEALYQTSFKPLKVPRHIYKKLVCSDYCSVNTLHEGDIYAGQAISKTDKLGLLLSGTMHVYSSQNFLHHIREGEFIDSPEFESSITGDEKYQVSILAATVCRYICWPRQSLEYLLVKEPFLGTVVNTMLGRDITNKLYALNEKVSSPNGSKMDIRLPSVSTMRAKNDIRKTVVGLDEEMLEIGPGLEDEEDEDNEEFPEGLNGKLDDNDPFGENSESIDLLNGHVITFRAHALSTCSETSDSESNESNKFEGGIKIDL
ncbi:hypothetical protein ScPMuIL_012200 [Solemya velum]